MSSIGQAMPLRGAIAARELRFPKLLPIVAPLTLLAGIVCTANIVQTDTWVALVSGREIARHGLPSSEHLTVMAHGRPWVDQQWLAQLMLYGVDRVGGVGLVVAVCAAAALTAFALAAAAAQTRGASPAAIALWLPVAFMVGPWGVQARTQSLALPLFGLVLWLIMQDPDVRAGSSLMLLAALSVWANIHGSVLLGAGIVTVHALQALIRTGLRRLPLAVLVLAPATIFASPYARALPGYYRTMLLHPPYGREIVEWQRTTPSVAPFFFAVAALVGIVVLRRGRKLAPAQWLLLALTFGAALTAVRMTPWFALAMLAVVPAIVSRGDAGTAFEQLGPTVVAAVLMTAICGGLAWSATRNYDGPTKLITTLAERPQTSRVYADLQLADWVLWEDPGLRGRVAYDGRPELMTHGQFAKAVRFARLSRGWPATVRGYSLIVTGPVIARRLTRHGSAWRSIATADGIVVLERRLSA